MLPTTIPTTFTVTITEEDRQKAQRYGFNCSCLVATAVRRHLQLPFSIDVFEMVTRISIEDNDQEIYFQHPKADTYYLDYQGMEMNSCLPPYYGESVVGKQITMTRTTST